MKMEYEKPKIIQNRKDNCLDAKSALSGRIPIGKVFM